MECGFRNLSHFYHVFKRETGTSPRRYRLQSTGAL
jgi:AraC-like DNA-binding protein